MTDLPAGTVTFLFTDIEGSTRLLHQFEPGGGSRGSLGDKPFAAEVERGATLTLEDAGDAALRALSEAADTEVTTRTRGPWLGSAASSTRGGVLIRRSNLAAVLAAALAAGPIVATPASASPGGTARASVAGTRISVAGAAFFPIMLIDQCAPGDAANARAYGINLIVNENCANVDAGAQLGAVSPNALAVLPIADRGARSASLVGWAFPDEPEGNNWTPSALRDAHPFPRGAADGLLSFMTTGAGFYPAPYTSSTVGLEVYRQFAHLADVAGFDLYPLGHCSHDLSAVYNAQRAFGALVGAMPTFQWIETGPIRASYCGGFQMTAAELRAEVWLAIAGGARGIGYFTHTWTPDHHAFDVQPAVAHQMARTNSLLEAIRPALVGRTIASSVNTSTVKVLARQAGHTTYVIAVNAARLPIRMKYDVPALRSGHIRVFGEHRVLPVSGGAVDDGFGPLGVHIYVQPPKEHP